MYIQLADNFGISLQAVSRVCVKGDGFTVIESCRYTAYISHYEFDRERDIDDFAFMPSHDCIIAQKELVLGNKFVRLFDVDSSQRFVLVLVRNGSILHELSFVMHDHQEDTDYLQFIESLLQGEPGNSLAQEDVSGSD